MFAVVLLLFLGWSAAVFFAYWAFSDQKNGKKYLFPAIMAFTPALFLGSAGMEAYNLGLTRGKAAQAYMGNYASQDILKPGDTFVVLGEPVLDGLENPSKTVGGLDQKVYLAHVHINGTLEEHPVRFLGEAPPKQGKAIILKDSTGERLVLCPVEDCKEEKMIIPNPFLSEKEKKAAEAAQEFPKEKK